MVKVEHWPEVGQLRIVLREDLEEGPGREVAPGVIVHYGKAANDVTAGEAAGAYDPVRYVEIEPGHERDLSKAILERYDEEGRVVHRSPADAEAIRHFREAIEHLEAAGLIVRGPDEPGERFQTTVKNGGRRSYGLPTLWTGDYSRCEFGMTDSSSITRVFISTRHTG